MPELPEVETMRRGILPIAGSKIESLDRVPCERKPISITPSINRLRKTLVGAEVTTVSRRGKRVILETSTDTVVVFEPRMTGLVLLEDPPSVEHLRFRIGLSGQYSEVLYWDRRGLGSIYAVHHDELDRRMGLGPDALTVTEELMLQVFGRSKQAVKVALLDQAKVAGIGNLYASEILHLSGVNPERLCATVTRKQWRVISESTLLILHEAIKHEGSTLSDGTYRNALNEPGGYQNYHRVYDRAGERCSQCGRGIIRRIVQCQRSTFFCPICQPPSRKR